MASRAEFLPPRQTDVPVVFSSTEPSSGLTGPHDEQEISQASLNNNISKALTIEGALITLAGIGLTTYSSIIEKDVFDSTSGVGVAVAASGLTLLYAAEKVQKKRR